jgi:hypothetical protein
MCTVHQGIPARSLTRSACEHSNTQRTKASPRPMPWRRPPQNDGASQEGATPKLGAVRGTHLAPLGTLAFMVGRRVRISFAPAASRKLSVPALSGRHRSAPSRCPPKRCRVGPHSERTGAPGSSFRIQDVRSSSSSPPGRIAERQTMRMLSSAVRRHSGRGCLAPCTGYGRKVESVEP